MAVRVRKGVFRVLRFRRIGPNGNTTFMEAGLGGVVDNNMMRGAFHPARGFRGTRVREGRVRCLCRSKSLCGFVSMRACSRVTLGTSMIKSTLGFMGRGRGIGVYSRGNGMFSIRPPLFMRLTVARARPKFGNSATRKTAGPTVIRAKTAIVMPLFIRANSILGVSAHANRCLSEIWLQV